VWVGVLVTLLGFFSYFFIFARVAPLRDVPWINLPLVVVGLTVSVWAVRRRRSVWAWLGLAVSVVVAGFFVLYVFVISSALPSTEGVVAVGERAPAFALEDHTGTTVSMDELLAAGSHVVLVFYRGFW
jgi:hypothetical protein